MAVFVEYRPEMPTWYSTLSQVFAISVVAMIAPVLLASSRIAWPAPERMAPRPTMMTGRSPVRIQMTRFSAPLVGVGSAPS